MTKTVMVQSEKGNFGTCSCGGEVLFYSHHGVQCKKCGKLYGVWYFKRKTRNPEATLSENKNTSTSTLSGIPIPMGDISQQVTIK